MNARILIVDDEQAIRDSLQGLLEDEGYLVDGAASGEEAVARFRKQSADLLLLDIWMPGIDGLETMSRIKQIDADVPVIVMSGHATIDTAVKATRLGAFDFVEKPLSADRLLILIRNGLEKRKLELENSGLKQNLLSQSRQELIGKSRAIEEVRQLIRRVAATDAPVLILGEHGTGKAVAARMIHRQSKRAEAPFIEVGTAGIPESRMDSELFGHERGAFPGALHMQRGRFELANGGTLFLDEVADVAPNGQAKILRVLQERALYRLGSPKAIPLQVRVIAATSHNPEHLLRDAQLREDFYYRLNVVSIRIPPLRERVEDVPLLVAALAQEQAQALGGEPVRFSEGAFALLQAYPWAGNVRELRNYIERCHILKQGETIDADSMLPPDGSAPKPVQTPGESEFGSDFYHAKDAFERSYLLYHLNRQQWNISRTAEEIGIERSQLHRKIKAFGLSPNGER